MRNTTLVLFDIFFGYFLLIPNFLVFYIDRNFLTIVILVLFVWNALVFHYLTLFIHAGAHYEICRRNKRINDVIANALIGYPFLISVGAYRRKHFLHHKFFGTNQDPENSYIYRLNLRNFILHFFFVIPVYKVFKSYLANEIDGAKLSGKPSYISFILAVLFFSIAQSFLLMVYFSNNLLLVYFITIFIPLFMMTPCLSWIRTCAEHRSFSFQSNSDVVCRNFKKNFLGFFLGAAGFRNHGLHHASPGLEYFKLDEKNSGVDSSNAPRDSYSSVIFRLIFS